MARRVVLRRAESYCGATHGKTSIHRACVYNADGTSNALGTPFMRSAISAVYADIYKSVRGM